MVLIYQDMEGTACGVKYRYLLNRYMHSFQLEELGRRSIWEDNLDMINVHNLEASLGIHSFELAMNHLGDLVSIL